MSLLEELMAEKPDAELRVNPRWRGFSYKNRTPRYKMIIWHHTASNKKSGDMPCWGLFVKGRVGKHPLPPPVVQHGVGRRGTIGVVADGVSNHAGRIRIRIGGRKMTNSNAIGIEIECNGVGEVISPEAYDAAVALTVVLMRKYDIPVSRVYGHYETCKPVGRKIDPLLGKGLDGPRRMDKVRAAVSARSNGRRAPLPVGEDEVIPKWMADQAAAERVRQLYKDMVERETDIVGFRHWWYYISIAMKDDYKLRDSSQSRTEGVFTVLIEGLAKEGITRNLYDAKYAKEMGWIAA